MTTGKTITLTRWTFVGKVMSLLFNMLSRLVITFLPRSKRLLISWLQSPSAVILEPPKMVMHNLTLIVEGACLMSTIPRFSFPSWNNGTHFNCNISHQQFPTFRTEWSIKKKNVEISFNRADLKVLRKGVVIPVLLGATVVGTQAEHSQ